MRVKKIFSRATAILAATVLAATAFTSMATAHSIDKSDSISFAIPTTPGGSVGVLGQRKSLPRSFGGTGLLEYLVKGQTSDLIISEAAAADDCLPGEEPFIGVDMVGAGGNVTADLTLQGMMQDADGTLHEYNEHFGDSKSLGNAGEVTELLFICLDLS